MTTPQAALLALKRAAEDRCEGCRLSWRLKNGRHGEPMPIECDAKEIRAEMRRISERSKP